MVVKVLSEKGLNLSLCRISSERIQYESRHHQNTQEIYFKY